MVFKVFDINGDGKVSNNEFNEIVVKLGLMKASDIKAGEINPKLKEMDADGGGTLTLKEYLAFKEQPRAPKCEGGNMNSIGQCDCAAGMKYVPDWEKCVPADMTVPPTKPTQPQIDPAM